MKDTPLIQVCHRIKELCKRAGIKKYSSKFSNKVYDNYQKIILFCLKQKEGVGFEAFIEEELVEMPHMIEYLGLETIPHPDTLNKFQDRIKQTILNFVLLQSTSRTGIKKLFSAMMEQALKPEKQALTTLSG